METFVVASSLTRQQAIDMAQYLSFPQWKIMAFGDGVPVSDHQPMWEIAVTANDRDDFAERIWSSFGDVPIDSNDRLEVDWLGFKKGDCRFDVWRWIEDRFDVSIAQLMGLPV